MWLEALIAAWALGGLVWFVLVWRLSARRPTPPLSPSTPETGPALHVFKPIPHSAATHPDPLVPCLESFLHQLRTDDGFLLGLPDEINPAWISLTEHWRNKFPNIRLTVVRVGTPDPEQNPKITKLRLMAENHPGGYWVWSDADITAPAGYLDRVRRELTADPGALVTGCYLVHPLARASALPDAVVVNLQLNPGLKILARQGQLRGAVGALCAFDSKTFHDIGGFDRLSQHLADDYELGRAMPRIRLIDSPDLETPAAGPGWITTLTHALRWQRTIHWCDPRGAALQFFIHPLIGFCAAWALRPSLLWATGLLTWLVTEAFWALAVLHRQGLRPGPATLAAIPLTGLIRTGLWLAAWLPLRIQWSHSSWSTPSRDHRTGRTWRTLLVGTAPWAAWWGLTPLEEPRARALAALAVWWFAQALEQLELKAIDAVFAVFFLLQMLHPTTWWGLELNILLLTMAAGSLALRHPFSLAYAREETAPAEWTHPSFLHANALITGVWTLAFATNTLWLITSSAFPTIPTWLPLISCLGLAGLFTKVFPGWYRRRMGMDGISNEGQSS